MAWQTFEQANIATLDMAKSTDPVAVTVNVRGEEVLTLQAQITTERVEVVGRVCEWHGELWWALDADYIRAHPNVVDRAARATDSAFRAAGWNV